MKDNNFYVYEWYILETNEVFYIGKGKGDRFKATKRRNKYFKDIYNTHKCGVRKIYENLTENEAFEKEIETIKYYKENTNYRLTNQTDGGEGTSGWIPNDEFREKQSKIHKEQWKDKEFRERNTKIRNDPNGVYQSKEFRNKISSIVKGKNNPNYNHKWTQEMKDKLRIKQSNSGRYKNENNPKSKKIICMETGEVFDCIKFAKDKYNIVSDGSLTVALKNKYRTAGNLHWSLYDESLLDDEYRTKLLINILKKVTTTKAMICLEDKKIYKSKAELSRCLDVGTKKITYYLDKENKFTHNDKTYILIENY